MYVHWRMGVVVYENMLRPPEMLGLALPLCVHLMAVYSWFICPVKEIVVLLIVLKVL